MRVLVGMSGGLDSSYSVRILLDAGHTVEGATLVMHDFTDTSECEKAALELGIPLHVIDCREQFSSIVKENLLNEYILGRTPNPCVICNSEIKFKYLYEYAKSHGFDRIATGHYARICEKDGVYSINAAKDARKDQSYMLWRLPQHILASLILPLSDLEKTQIRENARKIGLYAADKEESQEICFIPEGDYASYIESRRGKSPKGYFINKEGKILGEHSGIIRYTVGQRKGLGVALGQRMFVTDINPKDNTVTLSDRDELSYEAFIDGIVFSSDPEMSEGETREYSVKLRYLQKPAKCLLTYLGEGRGKIKLEAAQRAITPGQSAVFYVGGRLALGGFISGKN